MPQRSSKIYAPYSRNSRWDSRPCFIYLNFIRKHHSHRLHSTNGHFFLHASNKIQITSNPRFPPYNYYYYLSFYINIVCIKNDKFLENPSSMADSRLKKPMLQALNGEVSGRPPFWLMRQAGRYLPEYWKIRGQAKDFLDFCYSPDLAVEVTLQPLRRFHMDAAIIFSDILVLPDALGQKVEFIQGKGPLLDALQSLADIKNLSTERVGEHLSPVFETIRRLAGEIPDATALIGFAGAPWTVAVYMVEGRGGTDCSRLRAWADESPDEFQVLIDLLIEATAGYLIQQIRSGVEIIQIFDSWAGILSNDSEQFRRWIIEPTRQIVERLHESFPDIPVIGFPRNGGASIEDYVAETGVRGISLDQDVPLPWIAETLQPKCVVQGNLDNQALVAGGERLERETVRILDALSGGPFIFNLGHGVLPETPPDHVAQLTKLIQGWPGTRRETA